MAFGIGGPSVTLKFKGDTDDLHRAIDGIGASLRGLAISGAALGGTVGILGALGAAASAVVVAVAGLPLAFAGIGIAAAAQSQMVKDRFTELKNHVMAEMGHMTASIQGELLITADKVTAAFDRMAPRLENIFKMTSVHLGMVTDGLIQMVENALPLFESAIANATPLVDSFARGLGTLGTGVGQFFFELTKGTPGAVQGMDALFKLTQELLQYLGQLVGQLANSLGPAFAALEPSIMQVVRALGDGLLAISQALAPYLGELGHTIADLVTAAIQALIPVVQAVLPLLAEMGNTVGQALLPIIRDLAPVLADVARELADGLRPIIPVVAQAFRDMEPTIRQIAEQAGPLLAEIIRTLAPLFLELVRSSLELTRALLPIIPPLLEMANNAMPLVAGVINDLVIPAVKWLTTEFGGLIDYGVKLVQSWGDMSVRWRTYWDEIKRAFADADAKIRAGIDAWVGLGETARRHWDAMYQAIRTKVEEIVAWAANFPQRIIDAILGYVSRFYEAGQKLIQGFADGITSKAEAAKQAGIVTVQGTDAVFPQSPAREGPFSGSGWTLYRGQSLINGFIEGIQATAPNLYNAVNSILSKAQLSINDVVGKLGLSGDLSWLKPTISSTPGGGTIASAGGIELRVAPGADSALSSMLMNLVRTGQLQLARA